MELSPDPGAEEEVYHYYSKDIDVYAELPEANPPCSYIVCGGAIPSSVTYTLQIVEGEEYGHLYDQENDVTGISFPGIESNSGSWDLFEGRFKFLADGVQPDSAEPGMVTIRCTPSDAVINTVEFSFPVKYNPYSQDEAIIVEFSKQRLQPGESAQISLMKRNPDQTIESFPWYQLFEIGIIEGCEGGQILAEGNLGPYFFDVSPPFMFVAADSLETDSSIVVGIKVGLSGESGGISSPIVGGNLNKETVELTDSNCSDIRTKSETIKDRTRKINLSKKKSLQEKSNLDKNENSKGGEPLSENPVVLCFPTQQWQSSGLLGGGNVVVGDGCQEEIVVCNNYTPPLFENVSTITELGENDPWQWIDNQGNPQTTSTGVACSIISPGEVGITYIMPQIGNFASGQQPIYYRLDDMKVTACADKSNPNPSDQVWRFSVENMRIPIFRDHCPAWAIANNYIDLEDGTNATLLANIIKNCTDYSNVIAALDWWWTGVYRQTVPLPHKYYFSTGVIAHENVHVKQIKDGGTKAFPISSLSQIMNGPEGLPKLAKFNDYNLNVYKCPEDVLNSLTGTPGKVVKLKDRIKNQLNVELKNADKLRILGGVDGQLRYKSELEADELSRTTYDEIKENIKNWAKQQNWWCNLIVADYLDCEGQTCTP